MRLASELSMKVSLRNPFGIIKSQILQLVSELSIKIILWRFKKREIKEAQFLLYYLNCLHLVARKEEEKDDDGQHATWKLVFS